MRLPGLKPHTLRLLAVSYAIKTVLLALLFVLAPEWTKQPMAWAREVVARLASP